MNRSYDEFIASKVRKIPTCGFEPDTLNGHLFDWQKLTVAWAVRKGRCALFEGCGCGKGMPASANVLTANGWRTLASLAIGDSVFGRDGKAYPVTGIFHRGKRPVFKVSFSDGVSVICDDDHLWTVRSPKDIATQRNWRIQSLRELRSKPLKYGVTGQSRTWSIPMIEPVEFNSQVLPLHPYLLGVMLGDGSLSRSPSWSKDDPEIADRIAAVLPANVAITYHRQHGKCGKYTFVNDPRNPHVTNPVRLALESLGLMNLQADTKFVPHQYLFSTVADRLALLQGLMDTDGWCGVPTPEFSSASKSLAEAVVFLVQSFGGTGHLSQKSEPTYWHRGETRIGMPSWRVTMSLPPGIVPFSLPRKAAKYRHTSRGLGRWIDAIEPIGEEETICISVDSPDHLFVTDHFIVTHNTLQQLEWARQVCRHTGQAVLILTPLAVAAQTINEGIRFGIVARHVREPEDWWPGGINVTNYDRLHKFEHLIPMLAGVVLDESSCIKSFVGKLRNRITELFSRTAHRLCCTATPAPNDFTELGQQAEFLGICSTQEMLATWFINDTGDTGTWRLKGHAADDFWRWVASWAVCVTRPSDLGFPDGDFILPPLNIIPTWVDVDETEDTGDNLFRIPETSATGVHREQRLTCAERAGTAARLMNGSDDFWMVFCSTNYEADELTQRIPDAVEARGSDSADAKEAALIGFVEGRIKRLISKASITGYGLNLQHCCNVIYFPTYSFEDFYQAVRRFWRFGQRRPVNCYLVIPKTLGHVLDAINRKMAAHENMTALVRFSAEALADAKPNLIMETGIETKHGDNWTMHHGDCVRVAKTMADESVDFSVFSPPFSDLFVYSADVQDMGNNGTMEDFREQFGFLVAELFRLTKPGRLCAVHCSDLMAQKWKDGEIELKNFSGEIIEAFRSRDWLYHSRVTIWKDPVTEMQRTKALGLLHKQLLKDSSMSRVGNPEYVCVFRKPGMNAEPITHTREEYPVDQWQKDASPVWMDIEQGRVLNRDGAREQKDERHICPLQLDVINRCLRLWSNPGDRIFSPFAGIGSEGYCAVKMRRRFIGAELKRSYFASACANLRKAEEEALDLFSLAAAPALR